MLKQNQIEWPRPCFTGAITTFLNHLEPGDRARIEPHLETCPVARGQVLVEPLLGSTFVYFSNGPLISLEQGNRVEVGLVGSEGLVGWPAIVGCERSPYRAIVRERDGTVFRVPTDKLLPILKVNPAIELAVSQFVNSVNVQMSETIGAYACHGVDVRLARWILLRHDRVGGDEILVQHDEVAENLGARRASITDCLHVLEGGRLVRCRRGRILVRDRSGLEELTAGCYGAAEAFYRETIGSFGKPAAYSRPLLTRASNSNLA